MPKICTKCKKEKNIESFYKRKTFKDGYTTWCKGCYKEYNQEWENKNKSQREEYHKNYREKNKEIIKERKKESYNKNKEYYKIWEKEYYQKNKEKIFRKTKDRIKNSPINITYASIHRYIKKHKKKSSFCSICNEKKKLELASLTHIYTRNPEDYIYLCRSCHSIFDHCRKNLIEIVK